MKKLIALAAIFAAVMISFTACDDNATPTQPDNNEETTLCETCGKNPCECLEQTPVGQCEDCGKNPCECEQPSAPGVEPEGDTYPIKIDGNYEDWDALESENVAEAECAAASKATALTLVKVWADETFINVYMEFDMDYFPDLSMVPVHVYFNVDNSESETPHQWTNQGGVDYILEGFIYSGGTTCSYDPSLSIYTGEEDVWSWTMESIMPSSSGFGKGAGGDGKYEFSLIKEMIPAEFAETFGIGFDIQQNWSSVGILPNETISDNNMEGRAPMLLVTFDK